MIAPSPAQAPDASLATLRAGIAAASERLAPYGVRTPVVAARALDGGVGTGRVWYKCENLQRTGSFKLRGALNKVLALPPAALARGVVTSSTGNHGLAVAEALRLVGGRGTVVVSAGASPYKVARLAKGGLEVRTHDGDPMAAELAARALGEREGRVYISPYNDLDVVAGQGTLGVELLDQLPRLEAVYVAVGGGGLIAGVAAALKAVRPSVRVVGCWPEHAPAMLASIRAGRVVEVEESPTLSDGTAGNLEPGSVTLPLCAALVDEHVVVAEEAIARGVRDVALGDHLVVEGAAGVAVAGYLACTRARPDLAALESCVVLCGGNLGAELLARTLLPPDTAGAAGGVPTAP
jgi:threonine dehydratase